jgi:hypothetical protein
MGRVPIWAQRSLIGVGVLLCTLLMLLLADALGRLPIHKLGVRPTEGLRSSSKHAPFRLGFSEA